MSKINELKEIMALLRDPEKGCPWDIQQDFASIAPCAIEEAYEVLDAIEQNHMENLKEELGDLLLQVIFHAQMASEKDLFNFEDITSCLIDKLILRHPHVFSSEKIISAKEQEESWEKIKEQERKDKQDHKILDGIALALPAMIRAYKLQKRAAKVGFDWQDISDVFGKINEEIDEVKTAIEQKDKIEEEVGDLLFAVVNLARKLKIDPEASLRSTNDKFTKRFCYVEENMQQAGLKMQASNLQKMDDLWEKAKAKVG